MTSQASDSNCFVRPARVEDLEAMGIAHAGAMLATLQAGSSQELPVSVSAMITPAVLASGWQEAVTNPPSPNHHVLVATQAGAVVGLAALQRRRRRNHRPSRTPRLPAPRARLTPPRRLRRPGQTKQDGQYFHVGYSRGRIICAPANQRRTGPYGWSPAQTERRPRRKRSMLGRQPLDANAPHLGALK